MGKQLVKERGAIASLPAFAPFACELPDLSAVTCSPLWLRGNLETQLEKKVSDPDFMILRNEKS